ncbi:MAG TPA: M3 family metallopeptidase, partial [Saprospiraceae bacterium]|nr:M3 family metallopeptidase [Saprospiraceae bacterium]
MFKTLSLLSVFTIFGFFFNDIYMNQNNLIPTTFVSSENVSEDQNPLLQPWSGNYGGYPAFDKVKIKDFLPAFEVAMKEGLNEIEKIANNPAPPTFENTMLELEKSGHSISRLIAIYGVWSSTMNSDEFQNVETIIEPKLSEYSDKIAQNSKLFKRIEKIYNSEEYKTLSLEAQRLTYLKYSGLVRNGARLNETDKAKLSNYNQALAALYTKFSQNLLSDENDKIVVIENKTDLKGLSKDLVDAAASAGVGVNKGKWVINNTRSSVDPFLTYAENRDLREKVWRMFISRGDNGDKNDNNSTIVEILKIRAMRAKLLGFKTHADWRLDNSMAKTPENAMKLMMDVWEPAILKVKEEVADMQAIADKEGKNIKIEPWDYRYYAEKVRLAKYDLDQNQVKEYLQLDKLKEGMFWVAGQIFNMSFSKLENIPVYHPDVEVWEVKNKLTGKHIGLWYFDPYARAGKRSGAWMNAFRDQERVSGDIPTIVSNNANFVKGRPGEPVLISWDDASTLFHEFGHALHGLSSRVIYPTLSGTNVFTDYVEFPSQLLEYWLSTPEVLQNYALHYKTGNPIPEELVKKIHAASTFNEGFATTEYLSSALIDMKLHLAEVPTTDPDKFEKETLESLGMPKEIVMRHRTPQFGHIFSSDQYSAGYYSYLWADVLTADAYQAFIEGKG